MIATINRLSQQFEQQNGHMPNLLYINTQQLERLKAQLSEPSVHIISHLIGMDIIIVESSESAYVSWMQIPWRQKSIA